jgi:hypothetical protein
MFDETSVRSGTQGPEEADMPMSGADSFEWIRTDAVRAGPLPGRLWRRWHPLGIEHSPDGRWTPGDRQRRGR